MPLRIELKPSERLLIGNAVVVNGDHRAHLTIMNDVPILREKDILSEREANTPCKRIYLAVQLMYMDAINLPNYHQLYWGLIKDVVAAAPSVMPMVDQMSQHILTGSYYHALKVAQQLIQYEKELTKHVHESA